MLWPKRKPAHKMCCNFLSWNRKYRKVFRSVSEIVTLYVGLLALIGLLVSVGFFKLRIEPTLKLLDPVYAFDMPQLIHAFNDYARGVPLPEEWKGVTNGLAIFRTPYGKDLAGERLVASAMVPFQEASFEDKSRFGSWMRPSDPRDLFYHLGLTNVPATYTAGQPNFSAKRTNDQKRYGVGMPIVMDYVRLATARRIGLSGYLKENPLVKLEAIVPRSNPPLFMSDSFRLDAVAEATFVYSIVSIGNHSSEPVENVRVSVGNSFWSGPVTLVGWSNIPQSVDSVESNHNYHLTLERLEPDQSVEIVFRGHKLLREHEVSVTSSWNFDRTKVGIWMSVTLLLTILIYYGDTLSAKARCLAFLQKH